LEVIKGEVVMRITNAIADLRQQIHDDLRRQHPEWVLPNGESPMCDAYEARLMDLLALVPGLYYDDRRNWQHVGDQIKSVVKSRTFSEIRI
jgi:hypothetical protein